MSHEIITTRDMYRADAEMIASGVSERTLIERAGKAAAEAILSSFPEAKKVLVLVGPGNNGRDALVTARHLETNGLEVCCLSLKRGKPDDATSYFSGKMIPWAGQDLPLADLIIDGLFGAGLDRPLDELCHALFDSLPLEKSKIIAIDLPSGIHGDKGLLDKSLLKADLTLTFFRPKPAHLLYPSRAYCGRVRVLSIGMDSTLLEPHSLWHNHPDLWRKSLPYPGMTCHKYQRGHLLACSGALPHLGAIRLTAKAGLRIGAGLVTLACDRQALPLHAAHLTAIMLAEINSGNEIADFVRQRKISSIVLGPGLGQGKRPLINDVLALDLPTVLDADALHPDLIHDLSLPRSSPLVLTPHEGEAARLLGSFSTSGMDKITRTRLLAAETGAIVCLKGADTVIASPDGQVIISDHASPYLATAGSGDVLAGLIGGLLAQGSAPLIATAIACWCHGEAALRFGPGLIAEDLPDIIPAVLSDLLNNDRL